jgi:hypothetical protein
LCRRQNRRGPTFRSTPRVWLWFDPTLSSEAADLSAPLHRRCALFLDPNKGVITSNQAENFFSQLKRSLDGTHHHVSRKHLARYLGEFDFRYTTKEQNDGERMQKIIDQAAGRRLTYRPLVAV